MLELQNVCKSFGRKQVLQDLSVCFPQGTIALLGPNGAGKTTLLRTIMGLYRCKRGKLLWRGKDVTNQDVIPSHTGYLPQRFGVFPNLSCHDMLEYFSLLKQLPKRDIESEIQRCLALVNLSDRAKSRCGSLSGGMIRRLGIAQALLGDPKLLIFDEPTTGLDPEERLRFKLLLHNTVGEKTILISTHIVDDVEALCSHVVVMDHGKVIENRSSTDMAARAEGLVWRVPKDRKQDLTSDVYIRAMRQMPEGDMLLVLSEKPVGTPATPTVEDGYLCSLKGIGHDA